MPATVARITQLISSRPTASAGPIAPNTLIHRNAAPSRCSDPISSPEGAKNRTSVPGPEPSGRSSQGARAAEVRRCASTPGACATSRPAARRPSSGVRRAARRSYRWSPIPAHNREAHLIEAAFLSERHDVLGRPNGHESSRSQIDDPSHKDAREKPPGDGPAPHEKQSNRDHAGHGSSEDQKNQKQIEDGHALSVIY